MPENSLMSQQTVIVPYYRPSDLIGMFTSYLSRQEVNSRMIFLRGIYLKNPNHNPLWQSRYDILRDENTQSEITIQIPHKLSESLKDGNLVTVGGVLGRKVKNNGHIEIRLVVSRVEIVQEQAIDEEELKRIEIRRKKTVKGFKNVDGILEQKLFTDERPKVALVFATTSITMSDFNAGINAAKSAIDFQEYRVNFSSPTDFTNLLVQIDGLKFDVIALVRGGGANVEAADDISVLETIAEMKTPLIAAIGHVEEKLFIKQIVDKEAPTPNGLGQYFSEMVESVSEKKSRSRAVLTEQIKKQFQQQLEAGKKQNKELQEKLAKLTKAQEDANKKHDEQVKAMTKAQEESNKKHDEQVKAMTKAQEDATKKHNEQIVAIQKQNKEQNEKTVKQNEELQKKLADINKANEAAQKAHTEQLSKLQQQLKTQSEQSTKQSKEFNESLNKMQNTNTELNKSVQSLTSQNREALQKLQSERDKTNQLQLELNNAKSNTTSKAWIVVAIVAILAFIISIFTH